MCEKILMRYGFENWRTILVYRLAELFRSCKKIAIFFAPYIAYAMAIYIFSLFC